MLGLAAFLSQGAAAQAPITSASTEELKKLSFEELMNLEVMSVSRQPEKLTEAASAVQVITSEDIRRSGATSLPEALRLAPNLQVAQVNGGQWAISARGFNNVLANKLLVLVDGRTVYTPFYAGVFWDVQDVFLEDVEQIEVVSGPGGTLWGANAVNGVINIITKSAHDSQGVFAEASSGSELGTVAGLRYGGRAGSGLAFRAYAKSTDRDGTVQHADGADARDGTRLNQFGLRLDQIGEGPDTYTFQADAHEGHSNPDSLIPIDVDGINAIGRWKRALSSGQTCRCKFTLTVARAISTTALQRVSAPGIWTRNTVSPLAVANRSFGALAHD